MSENITLSELELEQLIREAREIANLDKTPGLRDSGDAYAHALGCANGLARVMLSTLESLRSPSRRTA